LGKGQDVSPMLVEEARQAGGLVKAAPFEVTMLRYPLIFHTKENV